MNEGYVPMVFLLVSFSHNILYSPAYLTGTTNIIASYSKLHECSIAYTPSLSVLYFSIPGYLFFNKWPHSHQMMQRIATTGHSQHVLGS